MNEELEEMGGQARFGSIQLAVRNANDRDTDRSSTLRTDPYKLLIYIRDHYIRFPLYLLVSLLVLCHFLGSLPENWTLQFTLPWLAAHGVAPI